MNYDVERLKAIRVHFLDVGNISMVRETEAALERLGVTFGPPPLQDAPPKKERAVKPPVKRGKTR